MAELPGRWPSPPTLPRYQLHHRGLGAAHSLAQSLTIWILWGALPALAACGSLAYKAVVPM